MILSDRPAEENSRDRRTQHGAAAMHVPESGRRPQPPTTFDAVEYTGVASDPWLGNEGPRLELVENAKAEFVNGTTALSSAGSSANVEEHSDLLTHVQRSATIQRLQPTASSVPPAILERGMECVIANKPPVYGELTLDEQAAARLARFNLKQAKENKRCHDKHARAAKEKARSAASSKDDAPIARNDMRIHVAEAMQLSLRLSAVFEHLLEAEQTSCSAPELMRIMSSDIMQTVRDVARMATLLNDRLG